MKEKVKNRDIRISQTDKGGEIVLQDVDEYINEANRQIENKLQYKKVPTDRAKTIAKRSNDIVEEIKACGAIDENTHTLAETDVNNVRCHQFYNLPKIHKSVVDTPGRPIVSSVNGPTEKKKLYVIFSHTIMFSKKIRVPKGGRSCPDQQTKNPLIIIQLYTYVLDFPVLFSYYV